MKPKRQQYHDRCVKKTGPWSTKIIPKNIHNFLNSGSLSACAHASHFSYCLLAALI